MDITTRREQLASRIDELRQSADKAQYPSLLTLTKNLVKSMAAAVDHALDTGDIRVEEEEFLDRMETCVTCNLFDPKEVRCQHESCGCFLEIKARMASTYCPLYLWAGDLEKAHLYDPEDVEKEI